MSDMWRLTTPNTTGDYLLKNVLQDAQPTEMVEN
jgi:hypothetical protein